MVDRLKALSGGALPLFNRYMLIATCSLECWVFNLLVFVCVCFRCTTRSCLDTHTHTHSATVAMPMTVNLCHVSMKLRSIHVLNEYFVWNSSYVLYCIVMSSKMDKCDLEVSGKDAEWRLRKQNNWLLVYFRLAYDLNMPMAQSIETRMFI